MNNTITSEQLEKWREHIIGKPCKHHPKNIVKKGKYGLWCGGKTELGNWCDGGLPE